MKMHDIEQGHKDWFALRMGKVTASELGNLLTPDFELRKGEMPRSYVYEKLAEIWRGKPLITTGSWATDQGELREEEALPWLSLERNWKINYVGFIESSDGLSGCSPDGIMDGLGIECKCPEPATHVRYLVEGKLPPKYATQVHGGLYVTGWQKWVFMSYQRSFPPLIIEVKRDEKIVKQIELAVSWFHAELKKGLARLEKYRQPEKFTQHAKSDEEKIIEKYLPR